jgi:hypothetical protein
LWAKELHEARQVCLVAIDSVVNLTPRESDEERRRENAGLQPTNEEKPEKNVRRLSARDVQQMADNRAALLAAINGKTYVPQFTPGKELFRGSISFDGVSAQPFQYLTTLKPVNVSLEDRRWSAEGMRELQLDWEFGYSVNVGLTGPGLGFVGAMQNQSRYIMGKVFIREGTLYMRPEYVERVRYVDRSESKSIGREGYRTKSEFGETVRLLPR